MLLEIDFLGLENEWFRFILVFIEVRELLFFNFKGIFFLICVVVVFY